MGVLENGRYVICEEQSFDELRKSIIYATMARHFGVFNDCEISYKVDNGKYYFCMSQKVSENVKLYTLEDLDTMLKSYLNARKLEKEALKLADKKEGFNVDEIYEPTSQDDEEFDDDNERYSSSSKTAKFRNLGDVSKLISELYKNKLINYDSCARLTRRITKMVAFDTLLRQSGRKPEDYVFISDGDLCFRLLNTGNNSGLFGNLPGFTFYTYKPNARSKEKDDGILTYDKLFEKRQQSKNTSKFNSEFVSQSKVLLGKMSFQEIESVLKKLDIIYPKLDLPKSEKNLKAINDVFEAQRVRVKEHIQKYDF